MAVVNVIVITQWKQAIDWRLNIQSCKTSAAAQHLLPELQDGDEILELPSVDCLSEVIGT